jgi:hypothetical protein
LIAILENPVCENFLTVRLEYILDLGNHENG